MGFAVSPGHDCAFDDWLPPKYVEHLKDHLAASLHERAEVGLLCTGERGGGLQEVVPVGFVVSSSPWSKTSSTRNLLWAIWNGGSEKGFPGMALWSRRLVRGHAGGRQARALSHRAALPPLVSFGLEMEEHFAECQRLLHQPIYPFGAATLLDDDLKFAAASMVLHYCTDG